MIGEDSEERPCLWRMAPGGADLDWPDSQPIRSHNRHGPAISQALHHIVGQDRRDRVAARVHVLSEMSRHRPKIAASDISSGSNVPLIQ